MRPVLFLSALAILTLGGCSGSSAPEAEPGSSRGPAPAAMKPATVALNWYPEPEFGGMYEAQIGKLYEAAGLDVTIQPGGPGSPVLPQVATGRIQFGITVADELILARSQGADVVAVFATYQTHPGCVMVHESRGIKDLSELKGGTLALEDGIPFASWLYKKYSFEGVTRVPYGGGVTQFLLDPMYAQQGYVTSEPVLAKKQGGDPKCFLVADTGYNPYANVLVTSKKLIQDDPELVRAFVKATKQGWDQYLKDGARANARIAELNPAADAAVLAEMAIAQRPLIEGGAAKAGGVGVMEEARWTELSAQLAEVGALTGPAPAVSDLFDPQFLK